MISIKISVDERLARRARSLAAALTRRRVLAAIALVAIAIPLTLVAAPVAVPNQFSANTPASAAQVNENFTALETAVNDADMRIVDLTNANHLPSAAGIHAYATTVQSAVTAGIYVLGSSYNSTGGNVTISGGSSGYTAVFSGVNCVEGGVVLGIASTDVYVGSAAIGCRVVQISEAGGDCSVTARCFDPNGNSRDGEISISYIQ